MCRINGFLLNMDKSVEVFAAKVRADPNLKNGFNAFGLSQGNNLIHGTSTECLLVLLKLARRRSARARGVQARLFSITQNARA